MKNEKYVVFPETRYVNLNPAYLIKDKFCQIGGFSSLKGVLLDNLRINIIYKTIGIQVK